MQSEIRSAAEVRETVASEDFLILYFYNDDCAPCLALRPKVEKFLISYPGIVLRYINSKKMPELNAEYNVYANPLIILYLQGKESTRFSKYVSTGQLEEAIRRPYDLIFS
ncbi:MAG: thioredoxin family protein [Bacteroidota bacterium]|nr:thioredoxin family protein [Bacteroidota bacterium]